VAGPGFGAAACEEGLRVQTGAHQFGEPRDTETAAGALAPLIGPETRVVTLQNGIDSVDLLARYIGLDHVVAG
jgi:hypothetical protein